jgi:hypothetical protein
MREVMLKYVERYTVVFAYTKSAFVGVMNEQFNVIKIHKTNSIKTTRQ